MSNNRQNVKKPTKMSNNGQKCQTNRQKCQITDKNVKQTDKHVMNIGQKKLFFSKVSKVASTSF